MSRFIGRYYGTKVGKSHQLCRSAVQAYLQSVCDPTGAYHPELTDVLVGKNVVETKRSFSVLDQTMDHEHDERLDDYLSEMADSHSRSEMRS